MATAFISLPIRGEGGGGGLDSPDLLQTVNDRVRFYYCSARKLPPPACGERGWTRTVCPTESYFLLS